MTGILSWSGFKMKKRVGEIADSMTGVLSWSGFKMNKRVGEIDEFTFEPLTEGNQLHVTIAISGWLAEDQGMGILLLSAFPIWGRHGRFSFSSCP